MSTLAIPGKKRIDSIDLLRGFVMIIMALDHVRDFFHIAAMTDDPTNMNTTTPALFFTRWITHFCAPVFVFLTGTGAFLAGKNKTKKELSIFLLKRGIWLVVLEIVVMNFLFTFNPYYNAVALQVIWVIGWSLILLSVLHWLPIRVLFAIGLLLVVGHNLLDHFNAQNGQSPTLLWGLLHQQYFTNLSPNHSLLVLYPLIPWPGVLLLGYCLGTLFVKEYNECKRRTLLVRMGVLITLAFVVIRWVNVYGDPSLWTTQKAGINTFLSFFNVTKYPPSFLYLCMTIGPALLVLAALEKAKGKWSSFVVVYGRVPMFYYLLHFFFIHFLCMIIFFYNGHTLAEAPTSFLWFRPNEFGYPLWAVYLLWAAIVIALFPLCKRYSEYKATHTQWWLSYL